LLFDRPRTPFETFFDFEDAVMPKDANQKNHPGEIPMMEVVGRDLFARGLYVARMISYKGVEFKVPFAKYGINHTENEEWYEIEMTKINVGMLKSGTRCKTPAQVSKSL
jgi:hypothetical protein